MTIPFELSGKWDKRVYPWRADSRAERREPLQPLSARGYLDEVASYLQVRVGDPESERPLVSVVQQCDWEKPDPLSLGVLLHLRGGWQGAKLKRTVRLLKWLVEAQGVNAALLALIESLRIYPGPKGHTVYGSGAMHYCAGPVTPRLTDEIIFLRTQLARASDAEYDAAVGLISDQVHPCGAAFLAPTAEDLVARALGCGGQDNDGFLMMLASIRTAEDLGRLLGNAQGYGEFLGFGRELLNSYATATARLGSPAIELIMRKLDHGADASESAELVDLVSMCPAPEAFNAFLSRPQLKGSRPALRALLARAPHLGLTQLSRAATDAARTELRAFVLSQPELSAALLPDLDGDVAATVAGLTAPRDPLPESTELPDIVLELADGAAPKAPKPPVWLVPELLPQIGLADRRSGLPRSLVAKLVSLCQMVDEVSHRSLERTAEQCDRESLAAWARAVFDQYRDAGYPAKDLWALRIQGWLGNDDTVRMISPLIQTWPRESAHKRAVHGLSVLSDIGTDVALMHLFRISQKVPFAGLRARAVEEIAVIADELELSPEQLGDRLVPDFGLSPHGTTTLDFGPRTFVAGFDETLKPYLTDADGKPRKALPKPASTDDPELAAAAAKRFSDLKKDVRGVAGDQVARLQRAMRSQRRFSTTDFMSYFVTHPLVRILARNLVWGTYAADGRLTQSFRVAEDNTLADPQDDRVPLDPDALLGIVHPLQLSPADLASWSQVFADYELLQPFPQLSRPVYRLVDAERNGTELRRFNGVTVPSRAVLGLSKQGWEREAPQDAGIQGIVTQRLPSGAELRIRLQPGIVVGDPDALGDQTITGVTMSRGRLDDIDAVLVSELLADLTGLQELRK